MTIALTGTGGLFTRVGKLGGAINNANGFLGTAAPTPSSLWGASGPTITASGTQVNNIEAQYQAADQNLMDTLYQNRDSLRSALASWKSYLQQVASNTVQQMANEDAPLASITLDNALALLVQQMVTAAASVNASVVAAGAVTAVGTPTGTPAIVVSVKDGTGRSCEYLIPETLTFRCTADAQTAGQTARQEQITVGGQAANNDPLSWDWPYGSGKLLSLNAVDASQDNQGGNGNLLVNGDFETFTTANYPDNWWSTGGAVGTNVFSGTTAYTGTKSLKFTGTGGTAASIYQPFNTASATGGGAGGTPAVLAPDTQYAFNCWVQTTATPAAGVLSFELTDGTATVIADDQAVNNAVTKSLTAVSTSWVNVSGTFRTPRVLPAAVRFRVRLSTDIDSGKSLFLDRLGFAPMQQMYPGGPSIAVFSGATNLINGLTPDAWTVALTNTWGAFQKLFLRLFAITSLQPDGPPLPNGLILPSSGSPTIADSLVA